MKKLLFAVPKGRILNELNPLFAKVGIVPEADFFDDSSRKIIFKTNQQDLEILKARSSDIATFVKFGAAHLGVCGSDILAEFPSQEIFSLLNLNIGKCRLSLARLRSSSYAGQAVDYQPLSHLRLATKYENLARKFFQEKGIQAEIVKLSGAIEVAPSLGLCDFIVDLVSSGKTLTENGMVEVEKILDVSSHLIVNRSALKIFNQRINQLIKAFDV